MCFWSLPIFFKPWFYLTVQDVAKGGAGKKIRLCFWLTPVSPGRSRLFYAFPQNFVTWLFALIPRWLLHIRQHSILDSDLMILHLAVSRL